MSRFTKLVATLVTAFALATAAAPLADDLGSFVDAGTSAKARTGNWCC